MAMVSGAWAATVRNPSTVPDGTQYYRKAVTGTTGTGLAFPSGSASTAWIYNEDSTNALLVKIVRANTAVASEELTAPPDSTWTEVQSIPPGATFVFDVRNSRGLIWDRAAGNGAFTVRLID